MDRQINRRQALRAGGGLTLIAFLSACSSSPDEQAGKARSKNGQAPKLKAMVDSKQLPPLKQRLPVKPMIVKPVEGPGSYGGVWRNGMIGTDSGRLSYALAYENLVRWNPQWTAPIPNVAESVSKNSDATEYTFKLRKGMRWSDGQPFTADDIVFAYTDVLSNQEVNPDPYGLFHIGGENGKLEKVDDLTVTFTFAAPHGLFLEQIASEPSNLLTRMPKHYLTKYHSEYDKEADKNAKAAKFSGWVEALQAALWGDLQWQDIKLPRLHPWVPIDPISNSTQMRFERNPYYWKVDEDGNQLPYLDGVRYGVFQDAEVLLLSTVQGEIDLIDRVVTTTTNKPVLARDRAAGGYGFFNLVPDKINTMTILLNQNCKDKVKAEIFQNKDFRIGLSHAINRKEVIEAVYARQGEPWQPVPTPASPFHDKAAGKQYTEYDVALANQHLDQAGFAKRGAGNLRLGPDGKPIAFRVVVATDSGKPELVDALQLVKGYWNAVGIDMDLHTTAQELRYELIEANEHDAHVWDGDGALDPINTPNFFLPMPGNDNTFAPLWSAWLESEGKAKGAAEPPEPVKQQYQLYQQLRSEPDAKRREQLMEQILAIGKEQFYLIGISTPVPPYGVVKNNFHNMPKKTFFAAKFPYPGVTYPEQFYIAD
ncbi:ABC transporter substrate-binding protein [Flindersiella endophytica]